MQTITPNAHECREWSRMAVAAYAAGRNAIGHRYSVASAHAGRPMPISVFDTLQADYRDWLIGGFSATSQE